MSQEKKKRSDLKVGVETDFLYKKDGKEGFWLEVIGYY